MTSVYFVRHAQPDSFWTEDSTRPLTPQGLKDTARVTESLEALDINIFYSSTYKRSIDTIADCAGKYNMIIHTDERLIERKQGVNSGDFLEQRWNDFNFCEENGENLSDVQQRNIEALTEILNKHPDKNIVIGTHGTALSTIINYYEPSFKCEGFLRIVSSLPYIIRMDFEGVNYKKSAELLKIDRGYIR